METRAHISSACACGVRVSHMHVRVRVWMYTYTSTVRVAFVYRHYGYRSEGGRIQEIPKCYDYVTGVYGAKQFKKSPVTSYGIYERALI